MKEESRNIREGKRRLVKGKEECWVGEGTGRGRGITHLNGLDGKCGMTSMFKRVPVVPYAFQLVLVVRSFL